MTEMVGFRWPVPDGESAAHFAGMLIGRRVRASTVVAGEFTGEVVQAIVVDGGAALWLTVDRAGTKPWKVEQVNSKDSKDWPLPGTRGWGVLTREDVSWLHESGISADPPMVLTRFKDGKPVRYLGVARRRWDHEVLAVVDQATHRLLHPRWWDAAWWVVALFVGAFVMGWLDGGH